jgi:hypothetical protein
MNVPGLDDFPMAELCSQDGKYSLKAWTLGYEFPDIRTGDDADWQRNHFAIRAERFRAEFDEISFEGRLIALKLQELSEFSALKRESVEFEPTEPCIGFTLRFNGRKNVIVKGYAQYPIGIGPKLEFDFESDLTCVDAFGAGLREILKRFPPRY